jgi:hypothetical protein
MNQEKWDEKIKDVIGSEAIFLEKALVLLVKVLKVSINGGLRVLIQAIESLGYRRKPLEGRLRVGAAKGYFHISSKHLSSSAQLVTWTIFLDPEVVEQVKAMSEELAKSDPKERHNRLAKYLYSNR